MTFAVALLVACSGSLSAPSSTQTAAGTPEPGNGTPTLTSASYPTLYSGVVGVISDFLVIRGTEFYPAIPPCTGYQATDAYDVEVPIELDFLPKGAVQKEAYVSTCPDGTVLSAGYHYTLPDSHALCVFYARAPYSYPVVLGDPGSGGIKAIQVNGRKGLLIVPERNRQAYTYATLRFWVADQYDTQKSGAYVEVGVTDAETPPEELAALLTRIAEGITVAPSILNP
jgi:hypothetical protein